MSDGSRWVEGERPEANTCQVLLAPSGVGRLAAKQAQKGVYQGLRGLRGARAPRSGFCQSNFGRSAGDTSWKTLLNRQGGQSIDFHHSLRIYWHYIYKCRNAKPNCQVAFCIS